MKALYRARVRGSRLKRPLQSNQAEKIELLMEEGLMVEENRFDKKIDDVP